MAGIGLILLLAIAAPAGAFALRWAVSGNRYAREVWPAVATYYGLVGATALMGGAFGVWVFVFFPLVLWPFALLFLLLTGPYADPRVEPRAEPPGFEVVMRREKD